MTDLTREQAIAALDGCAMYTCGEMLADDEVPLSWSPALLHMVHRIREAIAVLRAAGWQPIETAPKDGTWMLVIVATAINPKPWIAGYDTALGAWRNQAGVAIHNNMTHWMRWPEPPPAVEQAAAE